MVLTTEVNPTHYVLKIDSQLTDPASGDLFFKATVDISLTVKVSGLKRITLHSKELTFEKCTYVPDGAAATMETSDIKLNEEAKTVDFIFGPEIPQGSGKLLIKYTGLHK